MEYINIKKLVMVWLLIAPIIIIAEVTAQDRNQTQATCNQTQVLRQGKDGEEICCHSTKCKPGETFHLCSENDGHDICSPCGDGYFTALSVDTALVHVHFDPCIKLKCEDGAANINGSCICDILNGYYGNDSSRCIPKNCTAGFVLTLNGHCKLCERQDNCGNITSERQSSGVSFYWMTVGIVLSAVGIVLAAALIKIRFYRSRILKPYVDFNSSLDDISHTDVTAFHYRTSSPYDKSNKYADVPEFPIAYSGNDKTGKTQKDMNEDILDPVSSESLGGNQKEIKCQEPYIRRVLKEKETKQQALPLHPRPVVVDCSGNQIQQESSFSSYSDFNTYEEIEEPYNTDSTLSDEFQIEHVVGENVLLQEQNVSSGQNCEINNVVEVPYATAAENEYDYCNERNSNVSEACSNETHSVAAPCNTASDTIFHQSCKQKYILSETNDVTNHSHDDTIPKVVLQSDDVDNGEQPYFSRLNSHFSPHSRTNNPTVNKNLCESEKRSTEEDRRERRKEFVKTSERERKTSSSISQEGKDQCVRPKEIKPREETYILQRMVQDDKDQCVRPKEFKPREETYILQRIVQDDKNQCVRPKEFQPREETNLLQRIVLSVDKSVRGLMDANENMKKQMEQLQGENKQQELIIEMQQGQIVHLQMENKQQGLTIEALQERTQEMISIEKQLLELTALLGQETLPDKSHQEDNQMRVYYDKQPTTAESNAHL